jgi:NSS family neurotransmitter:Na+ symporter
MEGLAFAFTPEWGALTKGSTWITALGQALFSTGLGWGIALTFGSYLSKNDDVPLGGGVFTAVGNTSVGLLAIFAVFPLVFAFGLEPSEGSQLTFVTLPNVFPQMPAGPFWAIAFFVGFLFATISTGLAVTEVAVTTVEEETRLDRKGAVLATAGVIWLLGVPSAISSEVFGTMDFMFGNFGLPLVTLLIVLTVGWKIGPDRIRVLALNRNADNPHRPVVEPGHQVRDPRDHVVHHRLLRGDERREFVRSDGRWPRPHGRVARRCRDRHERAPARRRTGGRYGHGGRLR